MTGIFSVLTFNQSMINLHCFELLTIEKAIRAMLLFFFCSRYIFAATALGGSLGGRGTNINHRERKIIAGVRGKKHKSAAKYFSLNTKYAEKMFYLH